MHPHFKKLVNAHVMILRRNKCTVFVVILRKGPYLELIRCHPHDSGHFWNRIFCYSDSCGRGHKPLEEWFLRRCGSSGQIHWFHVDGRSLCVKKRRCQKHPDSCGRGLIPYASNNLFARKAWFSYQSSFLPGMVRYTRVCNRSCSYHKPLRLQIQQPVQPHATVVVEVKWPSVLGFRASCLWY